MPDPATDKGIDEMAKNIATVRGGNVLGHAQLTRVLMR